MLFHLDDLGGIYPYLRATRMKVFNEAMKSDVQGKTFNYSEDVLRVFGIFCSGEDFNL